MTTLHKRLPVEIVYFQTKYARAERLRLTCEIIGIPYVNTWVSGVEGVSKLRLQGELPFAKIPVLIDPNVIHQGKSFRLAQSLAILRYLGRLGNISGTTDPEIAIIDSIIHASEDLKEPISIAIFAGKDKEKVINETIPTQLGYFEKALNEEKTGYFVGESITIADIAFFDVVTNVLVLSPNALDNFPLVKAHYERIYKVPQVKDYINSDRRPK
eukprot:TRINITY_DN1145_c0_g5_i1.p1 TRINITY_DN1145_c0_g5~~TRINITY_DN1145_c0_g5_i1.p1  ORF type:complete len:214 (-),score=37.77 TRINITY_DN1145_c0_g5_i1:204-845(-)